MVHMHNIESRKLDCLVLAVIVPIENYAVHFASLELQFG
jgi:hypothetical protein